MREPLDKISNPGDGEPDAGGGYDRPSQPWVCGNAEAGCSCPFGPTPQGKCPEIAECWPVQENDRWRCNRPARRGGPCDSEGGCSGPTPDGACPRVHRCTPVRSLRTTRRRVAVGAGVFLAGVLAMMLGSRGAPAVVAPGPLTHAHARLMNATDVSRCANCHPGGGDTLVGHAMGALVGHAGLPSQSSLCLDCHDKQFDRANALLAHGLPAGTFDHHTNKNVACAVCHQEHHGADFNLAAMTNHRCQSCHQEQYNSLAADHPDFGLWPYRRRTRIVFDHARHEGVHYAKEKREFTCAQCHVDGENGAVATLGYEASCASCHDASIQRGMVDGVPMLALPTIDPEAVAAAGLDAGAWPEDALGDYDGDLPAPMKLLLAADPKAREVIARRGIDFSFFDLDPDEAQDAADAAKLADAIRELITSVSERGHAEVLDRLSAQLGEKASPPAVATGLSADLVGHVHNEWFEQGPATQAVRRRDRVDQHAAGGWFIDPATMSFRYTATGHADPVIKAWIETGVALGDDQSALRRTLLVEMERAGGCTTCHSLEKDRDQLIINWRAFRNDSERRPFTRFAHEPHLTQPHLADCRHCHQFTQPTATASLYTGTDPRVFTGHFEPISKASCVECHTPKLAGDSCTQCHNYHVDAK